MNDKKNYIDYEDGTRVWLDEDDSPELTDEDFARMRPAKEVLPPAFLKALKEGRVGRPKAESPKQKVTIRLDADIVEQFRATGKGWQTRMNDALKDWLQEHPTNS